MASAALQAFRRTVTVAWPESARERARDLLVETARAGHARIMSQQTARAGVPPDFEAYANTPGNRDLNTVVLPGPIVFRYRYIREVIIAALTELQRASPMLSGDYKRAHTLYIDGVAVPTIPAQLRAGQDIMISNPVPYARRLEVGKKEDGRPFVVQVEPHIYERVIKRILIPRYRNVAKLSHEYADLPGAWVIKGRLPSHYIAKGGIRRKRRQIVGSKVRAPALVIRVLT